MGFFRGRKKRCTKHKTENVLDKVLKADKDKVHESLRKIFYASTGEHAREAVEMFKKAWGAKYPLAKGIRFNDEQRALAMAYWQLKELRCNGVSMTAATKAILAGIRASKIERIAA